MCIRDSTSSVDRQIDRKENIKTKRIGTRAKQPLEHEIGKPSKKNNEKRRKIELQRNNILQKQSVTLVFDERTSTDARSDIDASWATLSHRLEVIEWWAMNDIRQSARSAITLFWRHRWRNNAAAATKTATNSLDCWHCVSFIARSSSCAKSKPFNNRSTVNITFGR